MTGQLLLDWAVLAASFFNMILVLWLGLTVLLNAERRSWGLWLAVGGMLAAAPERYGPGTQIAMTTVSARAADVWTFTVEGEQMLELPIGTLAAVPLQRLPRREYDQKAQVWLAPSLGYLPVRIRLTEANGDFAELNLQSREAP